MLLEMIKNRLHEEKRAELLEEIKTIFDPPNPLKKGKLFKTGILFTRLSLKVNPELFFSLETRSHRQIN
jgi:hypothetical protein